MAMFCLIFTSCKKTPVITLSVDKTEISANGVEIATFKVICNDDEDVTKNCRIFFTDTKKELGATSFSTTEPNTYSFYATYEDATSNTVTVTAIEVEDENEDEGNEGGDEGDEGDEGGDEGDEEENGEENISPIVLSASTDTIVANGEDVIKFTVMQDTVNVTSASEIFVNDSLISGNEFKTTIAGSYLVYAKKNDTIVSNEITFFAKEVKNNDENEGEGEEGEGEEGEEEIKIVLSASKTTILADGKDRVTFTVKQDGEDITTESKIYVGDTKLRLNVFTSKNVGTYTAYAMKGEVKSNEITITVKDVNDDEDENENPQEPETPDTPEDPSTPETPTEPEKPITLSASKTNIIANGTDAVTFTVMQENNDVTSQADIFINGGKLNGSIFTTYAAGTYTAYAKKNDAISNEITINVEAAGDMGKSIVFAEGVSVSSGWYDVNKLSNGGTDINMCWAASAANIIQWWQDRYVAAGNTLPSGAVTGEGTKTYNGKKYNLAIMELYHDLWWNGKGGSTNHGVIWYFEGRNIQQYASEGSHAQPLSNTSGGYYSNDWNQILQKVYHSYSYLNFSNLISGEFNNYSIWGSGSGLSGNASLKKFSDLVVEFIDRGLTSLTVALSANLGSIHHATTLWGYEIDNATGIITKVWLTDSDDIHQSGESGNPTDQKLREYAVSYNEGTGTIKFSGAPYGACYAVSLFPVSGYGSR